MNKQEKLKKLTAELEVLKAEIEKDCPKRGDEFYRIGGGIVWRLNWLDDAAPSVMDRNVFRTKEAAEEVRDAKLAICDLKHMECFK